MARFQERLQSGIERARQQTAVSVTIRRGARRTTVDAVPAATPVETLSSHDVQIDGTWRDWLVIKSDYAFASKALDPAIGDRIEESDGTLWEVLPVEGQPCWRPSDAYGFQIRVRTKMVMSV